MDSVLLALRVVVSLAIVIGLMWALSRVAKGRQSVRGLPIDVVARTPVGKHASVVIVNVQGRGLVLGVTESSMTMLAEVELEAEPGPVERREVLDLSRELPAELLAPVAITAAPSASAPSASDTVVQQPVALVTSLPASAGHRRAASTSDTVVTGSSLDGSILSPATWRSMATALRERSVRA
jgi:flagellar protein FliO/FliZ